MANIRACRPGKREMEEENRRLRAALEAVLEYGERVVNTQSEFYQRIMPIVRAALAERRGGHEEEDNGNIRG